MAVYELPDLPYDYAALEPHISGKIMELHHDKHHATYVAGINTALDQLAEARDKNSFATIGGLEPPRDVRRLHCLLEDEVSWHVRRSIRASCGSVRSG